MFKLRYLYRVPDIEEERDFERAHIQERTQRYLATNPLTRMEADEGYRGKVERVAASLGPVKGFILDLGGNTAGEATILQQRGYHIGVGPNALNPLRRASEVRDRFRGSIEKSFYIPQLEKLCRKAGFATAKAAAYSGGRSTWKLQDVPAYRRPITRLHGWLSTNFPTLFGGLVLEAGKAGTLQDEDAAGQPLGPILRSPINHGDLAFDAAQRVWRETTGQAAFPDLNGIPVLVSKDAVTTGRST